VLELAIGRRVAAGPAASRDLTWACERLQASAGQIRIDALATELGCSRKHLTIRFHREFGLPPKLFARILRFDHAVRRLRADRVSSWVDLAATCGYSDQAHMVRDFRSFAGSSPTSLLSRRLPNQGGFVD
jgi:AraC-like DNA-binding protein